MNCAVNHGTRAAESIPCTKKDHWAAAAYPIIIVNQKYIEAFRATSAETILFDCRGVDRRSRASRVPWCPPRQPRPRPRCECEHGVLRHRARRTAQPRGVHGGDELRLRQRHRGLDFVPRQISVRRRTRVCLRIPSWDCLLYTSPSPRDKRQSRMPSSA